MKKTIFSAYGAVALLILIAISTAGWYAYETFTNLEDVKTKAIGAYTWLNSQNEFLAAGVGLWLLGLGTFFSRNIPSKLWAITVKQTTVTLTLNNCDEIYDDFLRWYYKTGRSKTSRTLVAQNVWLDNVEGKKMEISAGYGIHYFWYAGKIFQFSRVEKEAAQTKQTKEAIQIVTIGRTQQQFLDLIAEITPDTSLEETTDIYHWSISDTYWKRAGVQASRNFDSVILPKETKAEIVDHIETFLSEREWYIDNGIPYRTGLIFHGVPGSGKTSLVRALCERFNKSLYVINLNGVSDNSLAEAFNELPRNSVVLMEDIDTYSVTKQRKVGDEAKDDSMSLESLTGLTLSGLLNTIDGIIASDGRILIATTNDLEKLDSALVRKGRFNISVDIGYLTPDCFGEFFDRFYPEFKIPSGTQFKENVSPAELQALIIDHRDDPTYVLEQCFAKPYITGTVGDATVIGQV